MNDLLIFLALAGLALVFKWLTGLVKSDVDLGESPEPNEQKPPRQPPAPSEEERVRKFLEALGVPSDAPPPPPVRPRTVTPRPLATPPAAAPRPPRAPTVRRGWAQPLPPVITTPPEPVVFEAGPPPEVVLPPPLPVPLLSTPLAPRTVAAARALPEASVQTMLRGRGSARRAIVLREVLGPPRGMQSLDEWRGV